MTDWPAPGAAAEAWAHEDTQVLGAPAASISFAGIPAAAAPRLRLYGYIINDGVATAVDLTFNNDGGANYDRQNLQASAAVVQSARLAAKVLIRITDTDIVANGHGLFLIDVGKPVAGEVARLTSKGAVGDLPIYVAVAGEWTNIAALINRADLSASGGNFAAGTRVVLEDAA